MGRMDKLVALRSFVCTVEHGGFSAAARELGVSQPAVSQHVRALEDELNVQLLNRSTRRVQLTDAGETYFQHAQEILGSLEEADNAVRSLQQQMTGRLAIGMPVVFGEVILSEFLVGFAARYPCLTLDVTLTNRLDDPIAAGLDVAIRLGQPANEDAIARRVGLIERRLVAAQSYLDRRGRPEKPADLAQHDFLLYALIVGDDEIELVGPGGKSERVLVKPVLRTDSAEMIRRTAFAGRGVTICHQPAIDARVRYGDIEPVLPEWRMRPQEVYAVYPSNRRLSLKVRRLVEEISGELARIVNGEAVVTKSCGPPNRVEA